MANEFCNIPPSNDTQSILKLLPPLPSLDKIVNLITKEANNVKRKLTKKIEELIKKFAEGTCPTPEQIEKFVVVRNNIVQQLTKVYNKVDRLSSNISGIKRFLRIILRPIKVFQKLIPALTLIQLIAPIIPAPVLAKLNAGTETAQEFLDKVRFKASGEPRLIPIINGVIAASIATKLFANVVRDLICKLESLDLSMLDCFAESTDLIDVPIEQVEQAKKELRAELQSQLIPIPTEIISFIEQSVEEDEESTTDSAYRGFIFTIEEVPFSPTVNRTRALAQNSDGITLLQTELSFTSTPDILIQELKLIIDRDNLRAE